MPVTYLANINLSMKTLFVVRHAKSSWENPELDDFERPLNNRGKRNAPEIGKRLFQRGVMPDAIISSPAKRALSTAKRIAKSLNFPKGKIQTERQFYHGSINDFVRVLQKQNPNQNTIMIFGHNPGLTELVNFLSGSDIYNIPTCGVAEINFEMDSWNDIGKQKGKLASFDFPKNGSSEKP